MATVERQVGVGSDDCLRRVTPAYWSLAMTTIRAGAWDGSNYQYGGGMRFTNITIPKGANITEAHLTLRCFKSTSTTVVNTRISAEDVDDAPTFADDAAAFDARWAARTTARVDWDAIPAWTSDEDYNSPEIKTVIQEIIDREGWASGQDIVIFWEDFEDRSSHAPEDVARWGYSYEGSAEFAPTLVINYTAYILHEKTVTDGLQVGEALVKTPMKMAIDGVALSDVLIKSPIKTLSDGIAFTDALEKVYIHVRSFIDAIAFTDALVKSMAKVITDGIAFTDTLKKLWVHGVLRVLRAVRNLPSVREIGPER